ncbi:hypothetical protein H4R99_001461 [Coemansia sp. RSA 1722]|nr:hypothetical protein LPJ57_006114 [Coemansia sp. RSA 486]KAJ2604988.1 hypothetical protein H4R99_001461 [Coemansia sp. RSA 1722]KAJ2634584.1 hypothetical protein GGF40_004115 [Coemansia sp. RSA 1286]
MYNAHPLTVRNSPLGSVSTPMICDPSVQQYSGYIDVSPDKHLFYWFFESRNPSPTTPLVVWLNGGPGCSSFSGLLGGVGPCRINDSGRGTLPNVHSWNSNAHVLFLDQPTNVGFSYGTSVNSTVEAAVDGAMFLRKFYDQFPQYSRCALHVMGESYAAHYVPAIAAQIVKDNRAGGKTRKLPLASIAVGNGLFDLATQFTYLPQMACNSTYKSVANTETCEMMVKAGEEFAKTLEIARRTPSQQAMVNATYAGYDILTPYQDAGGSPYDVRKTCEGGSLCVPYLDRISTYANQPWIRTDLGVRVDTEFVLCSTSVQDSFIYAGDEMVDSSQWLPMIMAAGVRVLNYAGDADLICNWMGNKALMMGVQWPGNERFAAAPDRQWVVDGRALGEVRSFGNMSFLRVYGAGHMVALDQPAASLAMLTQWLDHWVF